MVVSVYICLKLSLCLKTLVLNCMGSLSHHHPHPRAYAGRWWAQKDGVPGYMFLSQAEVTGARAGRCLCPGAEQLVGCRLWQRLEAQSRELALSFLQRLHPLPSVTAGHPWTESWYQQVRSPVMDLVQFYCYPHWEFQHYCLCALIDTNNYYSAPDSASPGLTLVSSSDLVSFFFFFRLSFPQRVPYCLLHGLLWILVLVSFFFFSINTELHAWIEVIYVQFRCVIICLSLVSSLLYTTPSLPRPCNQNVSNC